eukprot:3389014-Amphidinium_carterae.2
MASLQEIPHAGIVSLVSVNHRFWLCNEKTGERVELPEGHWELLFSSDGLGMLQRCLPGNINEEF